MTKDSMPVDWTNFEAVEDSTATDWTRFEPVPEITEPRAPAQQVPQLPAPPLFQAPSESAPMIPGPLGQKPLDLSKPFATPVEAAGEQAAALGVQAPGPFIPLPSAPIGEPKFLEKALTLPTRALFGKKGQDIHVEITRNLYDMAKAVPEFLESEQGLLYLLSKGLKVGPVPVGEMATTGLMLKEMVPDLLERAKQLGGDWDKLNTLQKVGSLTQAAAELGMTTALAKIMLGYGTPLAKAGAKGVADLTGKIWQGMKPEGAARTPMMGAEPLPYPPEGIPGVKPGRWSLWTRAKQERYLANKGLPVPGTAAPDTGGPTIGSGLMAPLDFHQAYQRQQDLQAELQQRMAQGPQPAAPVPPEAAPNVATATPEAVGTQIGTTMPEVEPEAQPTIVTGETPRAPVTGWQPSYPGETPPMGVRQMVLDAQGREVPVESLTPDAIWSQLQEKHGITKGGAVELRDDFGPESLALSRINYDKATGKPLGIEINRAQIGRPADLDYAVEHEAAHWYALENPEIAEDIKGKLSAEEFKRIQGQIAAMKYDPSVQGAERTAMAIQDLAQSWKDRGWFDQLVGNVMRWASDTLGIKLTRKAAESAAARALVQGVKRIGEAGRGEGLEPGTFEAREKEGRKHVITFNPDGSIKTLWTEAIPLDEFGRQSITRATTVEFDNASQLWQVRDAEGKLLHENKSRLDALEWEHEHFAGDIGSLEARPRIRTPEEAELHRKYNSFIYARRKRPPKTEALRGEPTFEEWLKNIMGKRPKLYSPVEALSRRRYLTYIDTMARDRAKAGKSYTAPSYEYYKENIATGKPARRYTPEEAKQHLNYNAYKSFRKREAEKAGKPYVEPTFEEYLRVARKQYVKPASETPAPKPPVEEGVPLVNGRPYLDRKTGKPRGGAAEITEARKDPQWVTWENTLNHPELQDAEGNMQNPQAGFWHQAVVSAIAQEASKENIPYRVLTDQAFIEAAKEGTAFENMGVWAKTFVKNKKEMAGGAERKYVTPTVSPSFALNGFRNWLNNTDEAKQLVRELSLDEPVRTTKGLLDPYEVGKGTEADVLAERSELQTSAIPGTISHQSLDERLADKADDILRNLSPLDRDILQVELDHPIDFKQNTKESQPKTRAYQAVVSKYGLTRYAYYKRLEELLNRLKKNRDVRELARDYEEARQIKAGLKESAEAEQLVQYEARRRPSPPVTPLGEAAADLTERLKSLPPVGARERLAMGEKMADMATQGRTLAERLKARGQAVTQTIKDTMRGVRSPTEIDKKVGELDWLLQRSSGLSMQMGKAIERQMKNADTRRAVALYLDAVGTHDEKVAAIRDTYNDLRVNPALWKRTTPAVRRALEKAQHLTPEELQFAGSVQQYFQRREYDAREHDLFDHGILDYFTHIWGNERNMPDSVRAGISSGRVQSYFPFAQHRTISTFLDGLRRGMTPELDPAKVLPYYNYRLDQSIASRRFIKQLADDVVASDGRAMVAPAGTVSITPAAPAPPEATLIHPRGRTSDVSDYRSINNPSLRKWKWMTTDEHGNPVLSQSELVVHPEGFERLSRFMDRTRLKGSPIGEALLRASTEVKGMKLGLFSAFHQVHTGSHALFHWTLPFRFKDPRYFTPDGDINWNSEQVRFAIEKGHVKIAPDPRELNMFSEGLLSPGLIHKFPIVGPWSKWYSELLFGHIIPKLKLKTFENAYPRNIWARDHLPLSGLKGLTDDEVAARVGDSVNNAYGELNHLFLGKLGRDPRLTRVLRGVFLAPDFGEARLRFVEKAATKTGLEERLALATMFLTLYSAARVGNWLSHGDPESGDPKRAFQVKVGDHWWGMRSVIGDLDRAITDFSRFMYVRLNPLYSRTGADLLFGRDINGRKLSAMEKLVSRPVEQLIPIQFGAVTRDDQKLWESLVSSLGLSAIHETPQQDIHKLVDQWMKNSDNPKLRLEYQRRQAEVFPPSDYQKLRFALQNDDQEAAQKAYDELRQTRKATDIYKAMRPTHPFTGSTARERVFKASLTDEQNKIYQQAVNERRDLFRKFMALYRN